MKVAVIGIDPGIVDTGVVIIRLDTVKRRCKVTYKVFENVSRMVHGTFIIESEFTRRLRGVVSRSEESAYHTHVFIEGYRPRGKNIRQDQQMTALVSEINRSLKGALVVDNTGVKNVVKEAVMALFNFQFPTTNHRDLESAARIALKGMYQDDELNEIISTFIRDALLGEPWARA